tara:strand:+ start:4183 stop:5199 length:1017 start_codon:yes stop_codon:yes gene_type:complete
LKIRKKLLREEYLSKRNLPKNFTPKDFHLFKNEIIKKINKSYVTKRKNILSYNNSLFNRLGREILTDHTKMGVIPLKRKIKLITKKNNLSSIENIYIDKASWVIDEKSNRFFHWYTDTLSRIFNIIDLTDEYPVLISESLLENNYIKNSLDNLKINYLGYDLNKLLNVETLLIASHTAPTGNYNKELVKIISKQLSIEDNNNLKNEYKNIWISRNKGSYRRITNEKELSKVLKKFNFEIYYPENHTFKYNQNIFAKSKVIGGLHGAGLTNMMFMKKGGKVIEVRRKGDSINNCYFSLASDLEHDYYYINALSENNNLFESDCYLDPNKLENLLKRIIN